MAKFSKRLIGIILSVCMLMSLFTCLSGLTASATEGNKMFQLKNHTSSDDPVVEYLSTEQFVKGHKYTFTCKYYSQTLAGYNPSNMTWAFRIYSVTASAGSGPLMWNMPDYNVSYDSDTCVATITFTAGDDPTNGRTMTNGDNTYIRIRIGDWNQKFYS